MKAIHHYILEKFQVPKDYKRQYAYRPKDKGELIKIIKAKVAKNGRGTKNKPLDLNDIDTSEITTMANLFNPHFYDFGHVDISDWNVSNVETMESMFAYSKFNGDISDWNVSKVKNMRQLFRDSEFDDDLSRWDVSNVEDMGCMFMESKFTGDNGDISNWNIRNVTNMVYMFYGSLFRGDLSKWKVDPNNVYISNMFWASKVEKKPSWYNKSSII